jgi:hypothetical protein
MTPETKRRALLAATKLALFTNVGCSASHAMVEVDAASAVDAVTEGDASSPDVADCVTELLIAAESVDPETGAAPADVVDESRECCGVVQAAVDVSETWTWESEPLRGFCCGAVFAWNSGGSCTPWGPPMPPAMPGEVLA